MNIDMSGKHILVTGGSRGIGRALAVALAASGARVAVHYHCNRAAAEAVCQSIGNGAAAFGADLSDPANARGLFHDVLADFGHLDALVNNAGVALQENQDLDFETWLSHWRRTLAVNLESPAALCRSACRHFAQRGGGRIVNVASRAAFRGDTPEYAAYAASKGGLVALTRTLARGYGKLGIAAFVVAPGFTRTEMAQDFIDRYGEEHAVSDLALDRMTEPEDIAPLVVLLASGLADHATGGSFDVNAGSYVH